MRPTLALTNRFVVLAGLALASLASAQAPAPAGAASAPAAAASAPPAPPAAEAPAAPASSAASAAPRRRAPVRASAPPPVCVVAQFKALGMRTHDPVQRAALAGEWLRRYLPRCSKEQVAALQSNLSTWLGTALTMDINAMVEGAVEALNQGNPAAMAQMYESLGPAPRAGTVETLTSGTAPAPVVRPMSNNGYLGGNVNYGNVASPGGVAQGGSGNTGVTGSPGAVVTPPAGGSAPVPPPPLMMGGPRE